MKICCLIIFLIINFSCLHTKTPEQVADKSNEDTLTQLETTKISDEEPTKSEDNNSKELKSFVLNDTTFLLREDYGECGIHAVYIEKNRKSIYYKMLADFRIDYEYGQSTYNSYMSTLRKSIKGGLKAFDLDSLPQQWLPLYYFEGKYYLYAPSDWGCTGKMAIDNFTIISYNMDGPTPFGITKMDKAENYYRFSYVMPYITDGNMKESSLAIYIVDPQYKIAVWEYRDSDGEVTYTLNVPSKYAYYFDLVHNYSAQCKAVEVNIGEPDYKSLLSKFRKDNNKH